MYGIHFHHLAYKEIPLAVGGVTDITVFSCHQYLEFRIPLSDSPSLIFPQMQRGRLCLKIQEAGDTVVLQIRKRRLNGTVLEVRRQCLLAQQ